MAGFLVPFATGALIERQRISDAYDEKSGEIIDTVSKKLTTQFDSNQKFIENEKANYDAVEAMYGTAVAELAAKTGLLEGVETAKVTGHVLDTFEKSHPGFIKWLKGKNIQDYPKVFQSLFSDDYKTATDKLQDNRKFTTANMNKGAISNLSKLYLGEEEKEPTGVEKAQKFLFGERITDQTGVAFESAMSEEVGAPVRIGSEGKANAAVFTMMKDYYKTASSMQFDTMEERIDWGLHQILTWEARDGRSFYDLPEAERNKIGTRILPGMDTPSFYQLIYDRWFKDPFIQTLIVETYKQSPVWSLVNEKLAQVAFMINQKNSEFYSAEINKDEPLPPEILKAFKNTAYENLIKNYSDLQGVYERLSASFKAHIQIAKQAGTMAPEGDPAKVAENINTLLTSEKFKWDDKLEVGEFREDGSGIIETFVTKPTTAFPQGNEMYIYKSPTGIYWGLFKDKALRDSNMPLMLTKAQVDFLIKNKK